MWKGVDAVRCAVDACTVTGIQQFIQCACALLSPVTESKVVAGAAIGR
jgi:hypothetical protein